MAHKKCCGEGPHTAARPPAPRRAPAGCRPAAPPGGADRSVPVSQSLQCLALPMVLRQKAPAGIIFSRRGRSYAFLEMSAASAVAGAAGRGMHAASAASPMAAGIFPAGLACAPGGGGRWCPPDRSASWHRYPDRNNDRCCPSGCSATERRPRRSGTLRSHDQRQNDLILGEGPYAGP